MIDKISIKNKFIKEYFHQNNILYEEPIAIALSGGVDSTVLFDLINIILFKKKLSANKLEFT